MRSISCSRAIPAGNDGATGSDEIIKERGFFGYRAAPFVTAKNGQALGDYAGLKKT